MTNKNKTTISGKIEKHLLINVIQALVSFGLTKYLIKKFTCKKNSAKEAIKMHENMSEKKIDKMVESSFPASDSPSTY